MQSIRELTELETRSITLDARIAAIRWDLVPFGMVWDLDVPVSERKNAKMCRAWIYFDGLDDLSIPLSRVRLPTGCWLDSGIQVNPLGNELSEFRIQGLFPRFQGNLLNRPSLVQEIVVVAKTVFGAVSKDCAAPSDFGLDLYERRLLGSEDDFLELVRLQGFSVPGGTIPEP